MGGSGEVCEIAICSSAAVMVVNFDIAQRLHEVTCSVPFYSR